MLTKEDLQAIRKIMKEEIDTAIEPVKEDLKEIRSALNYLAEDTDKRLQEMERKIS